MGSQKSMTMIQHKLPNDYRQKSFNSNLYVSLIDSNKLEKHTISIKNKQDLQYEQQMFIFRKCHSDHLIAARYFQNMSMINYCAKSYEICFYTEYPEYRLSEVENFPFQDGYFYLIDSLKGFSILSQKVGWFRVNSKMIVFDRDFRAKVWLSDDYSESKVKYERKIKTEKQFLMKIVNIFDNKVSNPSSENSYWKTLQKYWKNKIENLTIQGALGILINIAQSIIPQGQKRLSLKLSAQNTEYLNNLSKHGQHKVSNTTQNSKFNSNKQRSLKKQRQISQQISEQNLNQVKETTNILNNTQNQSMFCYQLMTHSNFQGLASKNRKISNLNDFTFNMNINLNTNENSQNETMTNIFKEGRNQRKNYVSNQNGIIMDKKKTRKSMNDFDMQRILPSDTENVKKQNFLTVPQKLTAKRPSQQKKKRISYQICNTKNFTQQPSQFKGYNLHSKKQQIVLFNNTKNEPFIKGNYKINDNQTTESIFPCSIKQRRSINKSGAIKSIIYSDQQFYPKTDSLQSIDQKQQRQVIPVDLYRDER